MKDESDFQEQLTSITTRLQNVIAALPAAATTPAPDQLDYAARRLHTHSQKPLTSVRQRLIIRHDLAAAAHWLHHLAHNNIISAHRLAPLQQEIYTLIQTCTAPQKQPAVIQPVPQPTSPPEPPPPEEPPQFHQPQTIIHHVDTPHNNTDKSSPIKIKLQGTTYLWTRGSWYTEHFIKPPDIIIQRLNPLLEAQLAQSDRQLTDINQLIEEARCARDNKQFDRAEMLARRIIFLEPDSHIGAAILCACLRARNKPRLALDETEAYSHTNNPALLTSRAAAYCDLGLWKKAKQTVGQALAIETSEEAFNVVSRIKAERPELY